MLALRLVNEKKDASYAGVSRKMPSVALHVPTCLGAQKREIVNGRLMFAAY
jgi:hypothetical protein